MLDFARDMQAVCPDAWLLNYTNPMAMLTGAMLRLTPVKTIGLCHSVQVCAPRLLEGLGMPYDERVQWKIAGINHQAWLLEISRDGRDLYPEIKRRAAARAERHDDMVRYEIMRRFGYYVTESSEHNAEYTPYFIKARYPELIERFNIPLDEYPRRCVRQIKEWKERGHELTQAPALTHERSPEYASYILEAMETNRPYLFGGNALNTGLIPNLPAEAVVEVACVADKSGVTPCYAGPLPEQCAALNRTNINVQLLTIEAARTLKKDFIYQAAMLDPHTAAELPIDDIVAMCDELIQAHGDWLPGYR
jgi:alpha-galactosidase